MVVAYRKTFKDYAEAKGIIQTSFEEKKFGKKEINDNLVEKQLYLISQFHKKVLGYENYICNNLQDKRGRAVEQCKIYLRKVKRQYKKSIENVNPDDFEKILIQYGKAYLDRAENCIDKIKKNGYLKLIKRSMDRNEICLGNSYFGVIKQGEFLEVKDLNECFYDLVEVDAIYFLNKLIKKGVILNYNKAISKFCKFEKLDLNSEKFIEALSIYPFDFMKCCIKYNKTKDKKYRDKLIKIISEDIYSNYKEGWIYASKCSI